MDLIITNQSRTERYSCIELSDGKKTAFVGLGQSGMITVCQTSNASHKTWRGAGRSFRSFDEARDAYKSSFMKSAVTLAETLI